MSFGIIQKITKFIPLSAYGIYKPIIKPQKVDPLSTEWRAGEQPARKILAGEAGKNFPS